ncbi:prepilin-type N-terminal cleavage/methylation domain-containing protein [Vibrio sp. V27_P1S3P104]|uniref:prepilin-type N-terminal cleavage/methylation domain-containing protein n=1 Tax=unclassified Vibrio TaxID=2614977 RepID=UPI00137276FD|nr:MULTISPECIES: prepilin-type N-terminal cleavage/methylation domain-containing protein [unclassified Vibrio]NAW70258.1 prepilin-type N-terminal cleavage/methylation domain-containing protein [Vibrio sp. V28_P6S34P95]NAX03786.1 prepilin-type N-terminal cleavage/methylation domain-containing protein [Vibrio sp. V30_P3S12P165]NAX35345.1 prepilin-type N-terminal cleavage/methylation domain-containing protein [Vibrio sp. V29_P1S30P107]NAX36575.1 prepilin-type N-terminal cleavage/methylation domain
MPVKPIKLRRALTRGFTLVEMIIVITLTAIAITGLAAALYPRSQQSAEQVIAVKAAELGRAVLDEILGRQFDRNSGPNGGLPECLLSGPEERLCTDPSALGPDITAGENDRTLFNDVDDFITGDQPRPIQDVLGQTLDSSYRNFTVTINVFYEQDNSGQFTSVNANQRTHYKRIEVVIIDSQGNRYPFAAIKGNY